MSLHTPFVNNYSVQVFEIKDNAVAETPFAVLSEHAIWNIIDDEIRNKGIGNYLSWLIVFGKKALRAQGFTHKRCILKVYKGTKLCASMAANLTNDRDDDAPLFQY